MQSAENPYASPPQAATSVTPRQVVLKQLRPPAIGLLLISGLLLVLYGMNALAIAIPYISGNLELSKALLGSLRPFWFVHLAMCFGSLIGFYTGIQLLRGRQHSACLIGAILVSLPVISPCFVVGMPFAIWALVVLFRQDTRAAFAEGK